VVENNEHISEIVVTLLYTGVKRQSGCGHAISLVVNQEAYSACAWTGLACHKQNLSK